MGICKGFLVAALLLATRPVLAEDPPDVAVWSQRPITLSQSPEDLDGQPYPLAGRVTILHFWATWCAPCLLELPELDALAGDLAGRGIAVAAVSEDKGGAPEVRRYLDREKPLPHLAMLRDQRRTLARELEIKVLPTTIIIGRDGRELARLTGAGQWSGTDRQRLLAEIEGR